METLTTLERAIRLQKVELFSELATSMLALLASIASQVEVKRGEVLVEQNHALSTLYVVLNGSIEMSRSGRTMFRVGADETIGNWALFDEQPSVVTATALEDTSLLRIDREDFFDLLADHSEATREMFQALFKRVRSLLTKGLGTSGLTTPPPPEPGSP
ncbi:MAG: cyclic nucleotide-binding domain-containing protein [Bryobacterales bacterium]